MSYGDWGLIAITWVKVAFVFTKFCAESAPVITRAQWEPVFAIYEGTNDYLMRKKKRKGNGAVLAVWTI